MTDHAIAKAITDNAEAQALRIEDQIEANNHMLASIENGYTEAVRILKADFAERNKSLEALAASIRNGTAMMPVAANLPDPVIDTKALFTPRLRNLKPVEGSFLGEAGH